jgi:hypothetical protein
VSFRGTLEKLRDAVLGPRKSDIEEAWNKVQSLWDEFGRRYAVVCEVADAALARHQADEAQQAWLESDYRYDVPGWHERGDRILLEVKETHERCRVACRKFDELKRGIEAAERSES